MSIRVAEDVYNDDYPHMVIQTLLTLKELGTVVEVLTGDGPRISGRIIDIDNDPPEGYWGITFTLKDNLGNTLCAATIGAEDIYKITLSVDGPSGFRAKIYTLR